MTTKEIAARIDAHLKRFEADPQINKGCNQWLPRPFLHAQARATSAAWVRVRFGAFCPHLGFSLRKADAERYLAWLDAGNVGKHWEALK